MAVLKAQDQPHGISSFRASRGAVVLIEATDREAAYKVFQALIMGEQETGIMVAELEPGLLFARAQPTGKYWMFADRAPFSRDG